MQLTAAEFLEILANQKTVQAQLQLLQLSVNQLLAGDKSIMSQLAALQAAQAALDQAVTALGTEEAADVTAINSAVTLIQQAAANGGIADADAAPIIADLQAQATNIQTSIRSLSITGGTATNNFEVDALPNVPTVNLFTNYSDRLYGAASGKVARLHKTISGH